MDCIELKPEQIIRKGKYPAPNINNHDSLFFHPLTQHGSPKELEKWGYDLATICRKKNIPYYCFINDFGKRINVYPNDIIEQWWASYDTLKKGSVISTSENRIDNTSSIRETKQMTIERAIEIVNLAKESLKAVNTHDQFKSWQITAVSTLAKLKVDKPTITSLTDIKSFLNYGIGSLDKITEAKESCGTILDGVISNFRHFGIEEEIVAEAKSKNDSLPGIVINNHNNNTNSNANHNSQSTDVNQELRQSISVTVEVQMKAIFESFTDELTAKQIRELNQIQASDLPSEEKKKSILSILGDKVLDFGVAVLANPEVWKMFT